jgi:hypothetical protein
MEEESIAPCRKKLLPPVEKCSLKHRRLGPSLVGCHRHLSSLPSSRYHAGSDRNETDTVFFKAPHVKMQALTSGVGVLHRSSQHAISAVGALSSIAWGTSFQR